MGRIEYGKRHLFLPPPSRRFRPDKEDGAVEVRNLIMKELINIFISMFLVVSPLYAKFEGNSIRMQNENNKEFKWKIISSNETIGHLKLLELINDSLIVEINDTRHSFHLANLRYLIRIQEDKGNNGIIFGSILGAAAGLLFSGYCNGLDDITSRETCPTVIFTLLGAGIGGGIGMIGQFLIGPKIYYLKDYSIDKRRRIIQSILDDQ